MIENFGDAHYGSERNAEVLEVGINYHDPLSDDSDDMENYEDDSDDNDSKKKKIVFDYDVNDDDNDDGKHESGENVKNNNFDEKLQIEGIDDNVVRMILQSINSILNFMTLNCSFPSFSQNDEHFNDYLTLTPNSDRYKITEFLRDINELQLESLKACSLNEMLLLDKNVWNWTGVEWKVKERNVQFEKIVEQIKVDYHLEVVHLYLDLVFKTIVKTVLSKTQTSDGTFPEASVTLLKHFYERFVSNYYNFPSAIVEIFAMFNDYNGIEHVDLFEKIDLFLNSVSEIHIHPANPLFNLSLERFLGLLLKNADSVQCFLRLYEFLSGEYRMHYVPFLNDSSITDIFLSSATRGHTANAFRPHVGQEVQVTVSRVELLPHESQHEAAGCTYFGGLNHYGFLIVLSLNSALALHPSEAARYYDEVKSYLRKISESLFRLVSDKYWHRAVFQTVYRTAPLIQVHGGKKLGTDEISHYLRLVYAVLFEFNDYVLKHCPVPEFRRWYPRNAANLSAMGRFSLVDRDILLALIGMQQIEKKNRTYTYLSADRVFFDRELFDAYEKKITFDWKSEKKDISYIERNTRAVIVSPFYRHAFYDVCIKFVVAMVFYELSILYDRVVSDGFQKGSWCGSFRILIEKISRENRLPADYKKIMVDVEAFLEVIVNKVKNNDGRSTAEEVERIRRLVDEFSRIGVYFSTADHAIETDKKRIQNFYVNIINSIDIMYRSVVEVLNASVRPNVLS